jgi:hypothetical protein
MFFDKKPPAAVPDLANLQVTDARVGDVLSVLGAGDDFSDVDFTVDRLDVYEAGSRTWRAVSGMWRNRRVFLEVHNEETVAVLGNFDGRTIALDEIGMNEADMGELDSRQNQTDFIDFEGKFWLYRFSREMGIFTGGHSTGQGFYAWQFAEQDGKRFLAIRKFQSEPFVGNIWIKVEPADVTVYRGN